MARCYDGCFWGQRGQGCGGQVLAVVFAIVGLDSYGRSPQIGLEYNITKQQVFQLTLVCPIHTRKGASPRPIPLSLVPSANTVIPVAGSQAVWLHNLLSS